MNRAASAHYRQFEKLACVRGCQNLELSFGFISVGNGDISDYNFVKVLLGNSII